MSNIIIHTCSKIYNLINFNCLPISLITTLMIFYFCRFSNVVTLLEIQSRTQYFLFCLDSFIFNLIWLHGLKTHNNCVRRTSINYKIKIYINNKHFSIWKPILVYTNGVVVSWRSVRFIQRKSHNFHLLEQGYADDALGRTWCCEWFTRFRSNSRYQEDPRPPHFQKIKILMRVWIS